ncbi:unnamed protein product [Rotaria socialis]|uniref:NHL repeat-containing protein n=1 Tax=Rotaria socialis TaxID=392032 RepID=A0A818KRI5_9BILA|nr:unnamed protein product [Rotaria socialis]
MVKINNLKSHKISVLHYWNLGLRSTRKIHRDTKIPLSTISYQLKKLRTQGSLKHRQGNGRKRKIDAKRARALGQCANHRVVKWLKYAKQGIIVAGGNREGNSFKQLSGPQGIIVAGGNREGNSFKQLSGPQGIIVDQFNQIYMADRGNNRVMCWLEGAKKGSIVVGGNGYGNESNQLFYPMGLSFDQQRNLYVADSINNRIQKFEIDFN